MTQRLIRAFVLAAIVATGLVTQTVRAASDVELLNALCYTFPGGYTVCCDAGGCYIK